VPCSCNLRNTDRILNTLNFIQWLTDVKGKMVKVAHLLQCHLQSWTAALLQSQKWQLIGTGCSTAAQASGCPLPTLTDFGPTIMQSYAASRHTMPQSTMLGLRPVIRVPNYMDYYSFTDPWGMDGWVGHVIHSVYKWTGRWQTDNNQHHECIEQS